MGDQTQKNKHHKIILTLHYQLQFNDIIPKPILKPLTQRSTPNRPPIKISPQKQHSIIIMIVSDLIFKRTSSKYRQYLQKINLTQQAKSRTNQLINQLALIDLIYTDASQQHQKIIIEKIQEVQKVLQNRLKAQGWMSYFSRSSEVVTLDQTWKAISLFDDDPHQQIIRDICSVKLTNTKNGAENNVQ